MSFLSTTPRDLNIYLKSMHLSISSQSSAFPLSSQGIVSSKVLPSKSDLRSRNCRHGSRLHQNDGDRVLPKQQPA
jgi:hypothetical protein